MIKTTNALLIWIAIKFQYIHELDDASTEPTIGNKNY